MRLKSHTGGKAPPRDFRLELIRNILLPQSTLGAGSWCFSSGKGPARGDSGGSFPAHPNQGCQPRLARSPQGGRAAGASHAEGASVLPFRIFYPRPSCPPALAPPVASASPAGPVCPSCPKPVPMGPAGEGFPFQPRPPQNRQQQQQQQPVPEAVWTAIPVLQEETPIPEASGARWDPACGVTTRVLPTAWVVVLCCPTKALP